VLLVAGNRKISTAIKYLMQSTWSHAALYVGDALGPAAAGEEPKNLIEVEVGQGCIAVPLSKYGTFNTRICRPIGLSEEERRKVVAFMVNRIDLEYDMRNIIDLIPTPPVPTRSRLRMIALGSGEPTRAICSTLIAQAFQSIRYPILPRSERGSRASEYSQYARQEILHIRHYSLFAPCDFDLSPYFQIESLRSYFDDDAIVEVTALIAFQNMSNKFNSTLGVAAQVANADARQAFPRPITECRPVRRPGCRRLLVKTLTERLRRRDERGPATVFLEFGSLIGRRGPRGQAHIASIENRELALPGAVLPSIRCPTA
jgi:hypothetical protein